MTTLYPTTETTSLLNYERRSNNRHALLMNLASALAVLLVALVLFLAIRKPHHVVDCAFLIMGFPRSIPNDLNSKPTLAPEGCESTIMLIRHCEKSGPHATDSDKNRHCSHEGFQRAFFLPTLFGTRWPVPAKLYALTPGRKGHKNYREVEMLEPLSSKIGVEINSKYNTQHTQELAQEIYQELRSGSLCGKLTILSWKHSHMPELARALGWKDAPSHYPAKSFDQVWQIKYVFDPSALYREVKHFDRIHEKRRLWRSHQLPDATRWIVYGSIVNQNFDPLAFSYASGDYPHGGKDRGESWAYDL